MPIYSCPVMENYSLDSPIYAPATAMSPSALAVIRTSGTGTIDLLSEAFSAPKRLRNAKNMTLVHGYIRSAQGEDIDEVVLSVWHSGSGYTGEEAVEIGCHGSLPVVRAISKRLEEVGFALAKKGEFTFRAFMHGRMDLTQAEAVEEIVKARSGEEGRLALQRLEGRLRRRLEGLRERLKNILASLEVQLDYAEDEILDDWVFPEDEVGSIISELDSLIATFSANRIRREGARVVLAGQANAGKSSLFNLLVNEERAIVSPVAGTTRDFIETWIDLEGIPVHLYDTAGLREAGDGIEAEGIKRSRELIDSADLVICLLEPGSGLPEGLDDEKTIFVHSKSDLSKPSDGLAISSLTGEGMEALANEVARRLGEKASESHSDVVIDSQRQRDSLVECRKALCDARDSIGQSVDIMALFFQSALESLGMITGEVTNDELLDTLFSNFCLGK